MRYFTKSPHCRAVDNAGMRELKIVLTAGDQHTLLLHL